MEAVEEAETIRGEEGDRVGDLPTSTSSSYTAGGIGRNKTRPKFLSRVSLVNALRAYTSNEALNFPTFDVLKETTKFGIKKRQKRTFEVDIRNRAIRNLSRAGSVHKKYQVSDIETVQRVSGQNDALDLKFRNANHAYRLVFAKKHETSSVVMRERFYQLLCLLQCKEAAESEVRMRQENANAVDGKADFGNDNGAGGSDAEAKVGLMEALEYGLESIRVVLGTFNLGGHAPPSPEDLKAWLPINDNCDVYVIGAQECNYKPGRHRDGAYRQRGDEHDASITDKCSVYGVGSGSGFGFGPGFVGSGDACDQDWLCLLKDHFAPKGFVLLGSHSIQHTAAIKLTIFVHSKHVFKVKNVFWDAHATGVANVYGNKGAVGCRFYLNETCLTFINVHLAAHEGAAHDRNVNTANILQKLSLGGHPALDVLPQSSYLFYLGDLNYRVCMEYDQAVSLVKEHKEDQLVAKDELISERALGRTLSEMKEIKISFPPTYRYNVPREKRELSFSNKKNQTPSYTDRILYHASPETEIHEIEYSSVPSVATSDHIPVRAIFDITTNLPFTMNPGGYLGRTKRLLHFKYIVAKDIKLSSPLLKAGAPPTNSGSIGGSSALPNKLSTHEMDCKAGDLAMGVGTKKDVQKQNQKRVNLSIKFFWPFGFDGKCKTSVVEASAKGAYDQCDEGLTHSISADWGEEDICKLFPRVMATEQLGAHPLAFQLIETRPLTSGQNNSHVIGTGKICLVKAAQHMSEINDEEIVVDTFVVKHGIRRGNLVCAFKANLEYY